MLCNTDKRIYHILRCLYIQPIAKYRNDNDPRFVIQNWMRNRNTVEFLAVWEELHNPDFNRVQFEAVRSEAGLNRFVMTPTKWIEQTNAIGIVSKAGRYGGGTYAHSDIAMAFATWISPEFQLYIMKDYRRLKQDENSRFSLDWNLNRALSKVNYRIHTDAVKENLIPPELTPEQIAYTYASEADLLNVALFGQTAKQWKNNNPGKKGNVRDDANLNQLLVLANMESYNAILIEQGKSQSERLILLRNLAIRQMDTLVSIICRQFRNFLEVIKSIKKRKDGSNYKDFYYYGCKHRNMTRGHKCDYKKQVHEEMLDASVAEVISNPKFSDLIRNKINMEVDTSALDQEIENYKIQLRKLYHNKDTILSDMDSLDYEDKHYQRRKTDLENHLYKTYDKIDDAEELLVSAKAKKRSLLADKITGDNIYKALVFFDKLYAQMNEAEKREFLSQLVDNVQIYEERKENGQWLKSIEFKLPIIEKEFTLSLDNDTHVETVVKLSLKKDTPKIEVTMELDEESNYTPEEKATYQKIKEYVKDKYGVNVHTSYIAQVKRMYGLDMGENYNKSKKENPEVKQCPQEKVEYIKDALRYFKLI